MAEPRQSHILHNLTPSFSGLVVISSLLRIALVLYSEWHDAYSVVKYTDVDYRVFSDAAHFLLHPSSSNHAQGPLGQLLDIGDPYTRATYRYTPLLALLLTPNEWLHPSSGKYLFALCDILAGILMYKLLMSVILPSVQTFSNDGKANAAGESSNRRNDQARYATLLVSTHLLDPLVFTISTRGSSEAVLCLFVLSTLYCALKSKWDAAAILLGLSSHWKIYPFIYGVACLGVIGGASSARGWQGYLHSIVNMKTIRFTLLSMLTFIAFGVAMYSIWGYPFLYESYLYHLHRLDHRHNFSPYFYLIYLAYPTSNPPSSLEMPLWQRFLRSPLTSFLPQMTLALGAGLLFGRCRQDLVFAWFVQTVVFVVFNKVCTSQYFLWYMLFLPLLIPMLRISVRRALLFLGVWAGTQALWLSEAYRLEFLGQDVYFGLWVRGLVYVIGNCWVLAGIMQCYL